MPTLDDPVTHLETRVDALEDMTAVLRILTEKFGPGS